MSEEGPFLGSRCVAGPGGRWGAATVRRVNEDGTFKVEFDVKEMLVLTAWYGVTRDELSFNDARLWADVFAGLTPGGTWTADRFGEALSRLGYALDRDRVRTIWNGNCAKLFAVSEAAAESLTLDAEAAYKLALHLGLSAKACAVMLSPHRPPPLGRVYWNQIRMGGRDPAEVRRPVTLADALAALGLATAGTDATVDAELQAWEAAVRVPASLRTLLTRVGVADAVRDCHSNNPCFVPYSAKKWGVSPPGKDVVGRHAVPVMEHYDYEWFAVFDDGDAEARIYLHWMNDDGEAVWRLAAPTVGFFFWDLAQTGLGWYQDTKFQGGKPVRETDIGLALKG